MRYFLTLVIRNLPWIHKTYQLISMHIRKLQAQFHRKSYSLKAKRNLISALKNRIKLKVVFIVWDTSLWKSDLLFRALQSNSMFEPIMWITPICKNSNLESQNRIQRCEEYAKSHNYKYCKHTNFADLQSHIQPDYIFVVQPYDPEIPFALNQLKKTVPCYIPYAYCTLNDPFLFSGNKIQGFYRCYVESEYIKMLLSSYMPNKGKNLISTGLPIAVQMKTIVKTSAWPASSREKFKLIWAPHWTISNPESSAGFSISSFKELADSILKLAEKRADICVAFKPHPWLKERLYQDRQWRKERTDQYFRAWEQAGNSFITSGDYVALFQQSDAMIHDSSSFIHEYLLVDKPCMYLERENLKANFNESTQRALSCYQKGRTISDIESFIDRTIAGVDPMVQKRRDFVASYLYPEGKSPVDMIVEDLLNPC